MSVSSQGRGRDNRPVQNTFQTWVGLAATTIIVIAIILLATAAGHAAAALFDVLSEIHEPRAFAAGEIESLITARVAASLFAFQAVTVICVLLVNAYRRRVTGSSLLNFSMPRGGLRTLALAVVALIALATCFASLVLFFNPEALRNDLQPFAEMMRSRTWWLILLAAGVGAPLAEELLFRGLIFEALRRSPFGFIGAMVISALCWALLHANYSAYGLGAIALIGLYLAWLRERTGSLLAPIVCHSIYNSLIIALMVMTPDSSLSAG